jgi:hypothetical protein
MYLERRLSARLAPGPPPGHSKESHIPLHDPEVTLGGYMRKHERAAAFTGSDGHAYSVALLVEDEPDEAGRFGAALLFVRWSAGGDAPAGHVETGFLAYGDTPADAEERVKVLSLYDVKAALDEAIASHPGEW